MNLTTLVIHGRNQEFCERTNLVIIIKVQYSVIPEYVETNKKNITQVMADLQALNNDGIKYSAFL